MQYLLDTHLLIWASFTDEKQPTLSPTMLSLLEAPGNVLFFSAVSILEVAVKSGLKRRDFTFSPWVLQDALRANGYLELHVTAEQAAGVAKLPRLHGDPFDRLLIAQAIAENLILLTADRQIARYPGPIRRV